MSTFLPCNIGVPQGFGFKSLRLVLLFINDLLTAAQHSFINLSLMNLFPYANCDLFDLVYCRTDMALISVEFGYFGQKIIIWKHNIFDQLVIYQNVIAILKTFVTCAISSQILHAKTDS